MARSRIAAADRLIPIRAIITSDLHGNLPSDDVLPAGDLLVICGDICPDGPRRPADPHLQAEWLNGPFREWLTAQSARYSGVAGIAGNHDFGFERGLQPRDLPWVYLEDSGEEIAGLRVWGSPWVTLPGWAFHRRDEDIARALVHAPAGEVDLLITHGPPRGILDLSYRGKPRGSMSTIAETARIAPVVHAFGHIHEQYGTRSVDCTLFVNASYCDYRYRPLQAPMVIDIDRSTRTAQVIARGRRSE
ncbi:MAG: hypothetical protein FJW99_07855 [Actinobacteria bacterium]|nr:hypothetical protein [Actinomycetota bacterium]